MVNICVEIPDRTSNIKNEFRERNDLLSDRLRLLGGTDRLLMTMYLRNGNSFRQIARLTGISNVSVARRINKVKNRLLDNTYIICLQNRDKFTGMELRVAKDYFVSGVSLRKIMPKHKISYHYAWTIVNKIKRTVTAIRRW
jgi:predicted DNA-binding protein YlxM (UPF0122 family)